MGARRRAAAVDDGVAVEVDEAALLEGVAGPTGAEGGHGGVDRLGAVVADPAPAVQPVLEAGGVVPGAERGQRVELADGGVVDRERGHQGAVDPGGHALEGAAPRAVHGQGVGEREVRERALEQVQRLDRGPAPSGRPARAKETSRAPKLCPSRWMRSVGVGLVDAAEQRAQALLADHPGPLLHLEVGELAQRLLGAVPEPPEGVAEAGRAALGLGDGVGEAAEHLLGVVGEQGQLALVLAGRPGVGLGGQLLHQRLEPGQGGRVLGPLLQQPGQLVQGGLPLGAREHVLEVLDQHRVGRRRRGLGEGAVAEPDRPAAVGPGGRLGLVGPALGRPDHTQPAGPGGRAALGQQPRHLPEVQVVEPAGLAPVVVPAVGEHEQVGQVLAGQLAQQLVDVGLAGLAALVEADLPVIHGRHSSLYALIANMTNFTPQPTPAQDLRDLLGVVGQHLARLRYRPTWCAAPRASRKPWPP